MECSNRTVRAFAAMEYFVERSCRISPIDTDRSANDVDNRPAKVENSHSVAANRFHLVSFLENLLRERFPDSFAVVRTRAKRLGCSCRAEEAGPDSRSDLASDRSDGDLGSTWAIGVMDDNSVRQVRNRTDDNWPSVR